MLNFLRYRNLSSDAVARIKAAEQNLKTLSKEYDQVAKKYRSGECDEAHHSAAFEARESAKAELTRLREEEFQYQEERI